jgi:hypothetical protein
VYQRFAAGTEMRRINAFETQAKGAEKFLDHPDDVSKSALSLKRTEKPKKDQNAIGNSHEDRVLDAQG